jgi:hypothetical protein
VEQEAVTVPVTGAEEEPPPMPAGPIPEPVPEPAAAAPIVDKAAVIRSLSKDPSLRFKESGRALLQWLVQHSAGLEEWDGLMATIPPHCTYALADLARECGAEWMAFAEELKRRGDVVE